MALIDMDNQEKIGDGKHTLKEWAIFHVDSCYEASSDFDRECMIKCVEVGYEAHTLSSQPKNNGWVKIDKDHQPEVYMPVEVITEYEESGKPKSDRFIGYINELGDLISCPEDENYGWSFIDCVTYWRYLEPLPTI